MDEKEDLNWCAEAYNHGHLIVAWEDISNITAFSTLL